MRTKMVLSVFLALWVIVPLVQVSAQDHPPYDEGTVWTMTFIRTAANHGDDYLKDLSKTWVASMEEAKAEGLIVDYKILSGSAANEDDFNIVFEIIEVSQWEILIPTKKVKLSGMR